MPAKAGIQGGEGVTNTKNLDSRVCGNDGRKIEYLSTIQSLIGRAVTSPLPGLCQLLQPADQLTDQTDFDRNTILIGDRLV